jgi:hypothetical protein
MPDLTLLDSQSLNQLKILQLQILALILNRPQSLLQFANPVLQRPHSALQFSLLRLLVVLGQGSNLVFELGLGGVPGFAEGVQLLELLLLPF